MRVCTSREVLFGQSCAVCRRVMDPRRYKKTIAQRAVEYLKRRESITISLIRNPNHLIV